MSFCIWIAFSRRIYFWSTLFLFKIPPKGTINDHTPLKPPEDSSPTYEEMEDISLRVSKLEDMIKGNVKIDYFDKLEKKMDTKEELKGMDSK